MLHRALLSDPAQGAGTSGGCPAGPCAGEALAPCGPVHHYRYRQPQAHRLAPRRCGASLCRGATLSQLSFTRYCHNQYCIVYSIPRGDRGGVVSCAIDVQWFCNSAGNAGGRGQSKHDGFPHGDCKEKQYLVKAKCSPGSPDTPINEHTNEQNGQRRGLKVLCSY